MQNVFSMPHFSFHLANIYFSSIEELLSSHVDVESLRNQLKISLGEIYMGKKQLALNFARNIKVCNKHPAHYEFVISYP